MRNKPIKTKSKNISLVSLILSNLLLLFLLVSFIFFDGVKVLAESNVSDAIATRVIPNPDHISAQAWYERQGFSGSPQSLIVDGYKAVRDGRTVYVSATNIIFGENNNNFLYSNIYLISYNQTADSQTVDIFGQILKNWRFNTNLSDIVGSCSISSKNCFEQSDCLDGYGCQNNKCVLAEDHNINCVLDSDCPNNLFCDGKKAKIVRDLDRLEKMVATKNKLSEYYQRNNHYPILGAGTYLSHIALSVWPSWSNVFLREVSLNGISDPINKLGSCADEEQKFDLDTCWNSVNNTFFDNSGSYNYNSFALPSNSYILSYITNPNGSDYNLCAVMETASAEMNFHLASSSVSAYNCGGESNPFGNVSVMGYTINRAPYISNYSLNGVVGQEFRGYIEAFDPEGNIIYWDDGGIPEYFELRNTSNPNQKMLYATTTTRTGSIDIPITIKDSMGASTSTTLFANISNPGPQIIAGNVIYNLSYNQPFNNHININSINGLLDDDAITITIPIPGTSARILNIRTCSDSVGIENNFSACYIKLTDTQYVLEIKSEGNLNTGSYDYKITVKDKFNAVASTAINIKVIANTPLVNFNNCLTVANLGSLYECNINILNSLVTSPISVGNLPRGLEFDSGSKKIKGYLLDLGSSTIVASTSQFGSTSVRSYALNVVSDCGTLINHPGGPWNSDGSVRSHSDYYRTVLIGNQCWFKDNLNIGTYVDYPIASSSGSVLEKRCYGNNSLNCDIYGGLYDWDEMTNNNICPLGWRIPTDSDWHILEKSLKATSSTCNPYRDSHCAFACSPAGEKIKQNMAIQIYPGPERVSFWTSKNTDNYGATSTTTFLSRSLSNSGGEADKVARDFISKDNFLSVRCIKDIPQCYQDSDCHYFNDGYNCNSNMCVLPNLSPGDIICPIGSDL